MTQKAHACISWSHKILAPAGNCHNSHGTNAMCQRDRQSSSLSSSVVGNRSETLITVDSIIIPPAVTVANSADTVVISSIDLYQNDVPAFHKLHFFFVVHPRSAIVQLRTDGSVYICRASHSPVNGCRCQGLIAFVVECNANNAMLYHVFRPCL